ncbi:hypothetical protein SNK03_13579 [Fusarium graminearum]
MYYVASKVGHLRTKGSPSIVQRVTSLSPQHFRTCKRTKTPEPEGRPRNIYKDNANTNFRCDQPGETVYNSSEDWRAFRTCLTNAVRKDAMELTFKVLQGPDIIKTERGYCPSGWDCANAITTDISHSTNGSHSQVHQPQSQLRRFPPTHPHMETCYIHLNLKEKQINYVTASLAQIARAGPRSGQSLKHIKRKHQREIWRPTDGCTETFRYRHETRLYIEDDNPGKRLPYRIPD